MLLVHLQIYNVNHHLRPVLQIQVIDVCSDNNSSFISSVESDNGTSLSLNVNDLNSTLDNVSDDDDVREQSVQEVNEDEESVPQVEIICSDSDAVV